jgi:hypothetical protein
VACSCAPDCVAEPGGLAAGAAAAGFLAQCQRVRAGAGRWPDHRGDGVGSPHQRPAPDPRGPQDGAGGQPGRARVGGSSVSGTSWSVRAKWLHDDRQESRQGLSRACHRREFCRRGWRRRGQARLGGSGRFPHASSGLRASGCTCRPTRARSDCCCLAGSWTRSCWRQRQGCASTPQCSCWPGASPRSGLPVGLGSRRLRISLSVPFRPVFSPHRPAVGSKIRQPPGVATRKDRKKAEALDSARWPGTKNSAAGLPNDYLQRLDRVRDAVTGVDASGAQRGGNAVASQVVKGG